jgi:hypothetical protein
MLFNYQHKNMKNQRVKLMKNSYLLAFFINKMLCEKVNF